MIRMAVLLLGLCSLGSAQPRNAVLPWWENPVTSGLDLSTLQQTQIREVLRDYRNRLVDARAAVDKAENDLEDVFNEPVVDQRRGNQAIAKLAVARSELTTAVSEMTLRLRAILTAEQWQELQRRERERASPEGRGRGRKSITQQARPKVTVSKN
jgi:Spy/CpxP family protein refolding chaperone